MAFATVSETLKSLPKPKTTTVNVSELVTDPKIQIRFQSGEATFGFKTEFDDTNINALKVSIQDVGKILVPLVIWKRPKEDGQELVILQGNCRSKAGKSLMADENCSKALHEALSKTQAFVYEGITEEQALALVDDQSSVNRYKRVDVVNVVWKAMYRITDFKEIGLAHARLIGEVYLDNSIEAKKNLVKLGECKTRTEQLAVIGTWLRGSLDQGIMDANLLGDRNRKAFLLTVAHEDGLLKEGMEKPEYNPKTRQAVPDSKTPKTRIAILKALKKALMEKGEKDWEHCAEFNAKIDEFVKEDSGEKVKETINRPTGAALAKLRDASRSTAVKAAYANASGDKMDSMEVIDTEAYRVESIMAEVSKILPSINNPDVAKVLAYVLKCSNSAEFVLAMKAYIG